MRLRTLAKVCAVVRWITYFVILADTVAILRFSDDMDSYDFFWTGLSFVIALITGYLAFELEPYPYEIVGEERRIREEERQARQDRLTL